MAPSTRATWLMLMAVAAFAGMDTSMKLLAAHYPPLQVSALRGFASLPFVLVWVMSTKGLASIRPVRWGLHLLRGVLAIAMIVGFVYGLARLPLSSTYAITFIAPLLVTALAVPLLGEKVGPRRWAAIGVGMFGVLVILRPGGDVFSLAGLSVLLATFCWAASAITVRVLTRSDTTQSMVVWMLVLLGFGAAALAWSSWLPIRSADWATVLMLGAFGACGQVLLTEAFRLGEASKIAPLEYTALLWSLGIDLALWGVLPDAVTWLGAAIIVASGLYLIRRECVHDVTEPP
ncbi:DMT family transporter [Solilutibacter tolerans]|uniref:EamA domain-containing membrane protein RarD n=1 Tax=Solilutibacter tolerans TaxID=1604334 RepID=A0A1N6Y8Y8_9GAMM|nr:DMT family transporter [Lysobacter tolerans]SIR11105.1 EamA domain-containing membrane protein RarD [Lysobacter tolerans]